MSLSLAGRRRSPTWECPDDQQIPLEPCRSSALRDRGGVAEPVRTGTLKQLGQRLAVLEKALGERPPCLHGLSVQDLARLLEAEIAYPYRMEVLLNALSDDQVEQMYAAMSEEPRR